MVILDNGEIVAQGNKYEVLTDKNLSKLYEIDVKIEWSNNRPWLIVKWYNTYILYKNKWVTYLR